jgi:hypothetical protein
VASKMMPFLKSRPGRGRPGWRSTKGKADEDEEEVENERSM